MLSFRKCEGWRDVSLVDLRQPLFDSPDAASRNVVDIYELELIDEDGREINVYDVDGYRVPRRIPLHQESDSPCGLLADLTRVRSLFEHSAQTQRDTHLVDEDFSDCEDEGLVVNVYPQAFTRRYGYFQANAVPAGFLPLMKSMNRELPENADEAYPVLRGVSCQGYNHVQHCLTEHAGGLEVVHGNITAVLAGSGRTSSVKGKRVQQKLLDKISLCRPHGRVEVKLTRNEAIERGFRVEPIWLVDLYQLKPQFRNGRCIQS